MSGGCEGAVLGRWQGSSLRSADGGAGTTEPSGGCDGILLGTNDCREKKATAGAGTSEPSGGV